MNINTLGKIGEYRVIYELLNRGHQVFYNLNDINGIDLIILNNNNVFKKIQIKNANKFGYADTKNKLYKRYSYRITSNKVDFFIAIAEEVFYIIPAINVKSTSFFIFPEKKKKTTLNNYKECWSLLDT